MKIKAIAAVLAASAVLSLHAQESVRAMGEVPGIELAPAPRLDPDMPMPLTAPGFTTKAVVSVPAIDTSNMSSVLNAFNAYYNIPQPPVGFVGSTAGCNAGTESLAFQEWTISRINFLRAMAGVYGNTSLDTTQNGNEQAAALIMSANNTLNHQPPNTYTCWTQAGYNGAGSSNLALGVTDAVQIYMSEPGGGNQVVGHRRWLLHSAKNSFGHGQVTDGPNTNAMYVFQGAGSSFPTPNGIPWPPRGYVPLQLFPTQFTSTQRWSFGLPYANFAGANVSVTLNGSPVPVTVVSRTDNGYGDNTIVWEMPAGHTVAANTTYTVTITGVASAAQTSYTYQIFPFDTANVMPNVVLAQSASTTSTTPGKDVVFTITAANTGGSPASNVNLQIGYTWGAVWASAGCTINPGVVSCPIGTIAGGGTAQVKLVLRALNTGAPLSSTVTENDSLSLGNPTPNTNSLSVDVTAAPAANAVLRYRLYSPISLEHHYTTDLNEYTVLGASGSWIQEGVVGKVLNNPGSFNGVTATPYYRLYNTVTLWHHWTTDPNEYYTLIGYPGWNGEGIDGYILPSATAGATQLYRLVYPNGTGLHHWTIDSNEYTTLINTYGWVGEGGAGFVLQ